ncbi:hypothetical protein CUT44_12570 [Streptomyces carminius]|uniref:Uncharacterized protein n=1 Tax=Streptomyces carminius TaxID=2665496 RepID=A0A2M8M029_9ACTN|nr:hypothetical protein CUT44_12570 [Streptomyces carminius]
MRAAALLAGVGAVTLYVWGLLHLAGAVAEAEDGGTDSSPLRPCHTADAQAASHVDGYRVSYVPLRFECGLTGGGAYDAPVVPGYVNPAVALLGLTAVACGILAATGPAAPAPTAAAPQR